MIPLPEILAELVMALGGALLAANAWALVRPVVRPNSAGPGRPQALSKVLINIAIGVVVFVWGLASFITRTHH